jgi:enolase-phosphatase E1
VLLDIEGTTSPIAFVHDVLFPFARTHLQPFLRDAANADAVQRIATALAAERSHENGPDTPPLWRATTPDETLASVAAYAEWLMDRDRKSPGLKQLQGLIWEGGYRAGALKGEIFEDVAPAIRRWHDAGVAVAIYSSGSALAQRLLFQSTTAGDLTTLLAAFFDTAVGPKRDADSYRAIAKDLSIAPSAILFISDVTAELSAARSAGFQVLLSVRPGNAEPIDADGFESVRTFAGL